MRRILPKPRTQPASVNVPRETQPLPAPMSFSPGASNDNDDANFVLRGAAGGDHSKITRRIIEMVRQAPYIYDTAHQDFKDKTKKTAFWRHSAGLLINQNNPAGARDLKQRWKHIRDYYIRELKRMQAETVTKYDQYGTAYTNVKKKWMYTDQLNFLRKHLTIRIDAIESADNASDSFSDTPPNPTAGHSAADYVHNALSSEVHDDSVCVVVVDDDVKPDISSAKSNEHSLSTSSIFTSNNETQSDTSSTDAAFAFTSNHPPSHETFAAHRTRPVPTLADPSATPTEGAGRRPQVIATRPSSQQQWNGQPANSFAPHRAESSGPFSSLGCHDNRHVPFQSPSAPQNAAFGRYVSASLDALLPAAASQCRNRIAQLLAEAELSQPQQLVDEATGQIYYS